MSFDKDTRNLLAKTVAACRRRLIEDVTDQLRGLFGLHPDGTVLPLDKLTHLSPDQNSAARRLRDLLDHYTVGAVGKDSERRKAAYERMVLEISFTALNRSAALRLCEERGLVVECVRKGTTSAGFQMFERITGGALGGRYDTYRVFLECIFDELALDLGVLFDRMTPQSAVFPSEGCMEDILAELNRTELTHLWIEDETIGWVYQYFNPPEERKAMREASQAPRNSRELAVRNQFFTPRYVVEFLTDNTLGRIWYEMTQGQTGLKDTCRYLVRRPDEVFLDDKHSSSDAAAKRWLMGEVEERPTASELADTVDTYKRHASVEAAADWLYSNITRVTAGETKCMNTQDLLDLLFMLHRADHFSEGTLDHYCAEIKRIIDELAERRNQRKSDDQTQEVLLNQPVFIPYRKVKDPREILMLDPACGSMHFGLYAFDVYETIYREALHPTFGVRKKLLATVGWAGAPELTILPASVKLKHDAMAFSDYLSQEIALDEAFVVVASEPDGGDGVEANRPYIVRADNKFRVPMSRHVPLIQFDYARAVQEGLFSARFGDTFVKESRCFVYQEPLTDDQAEEHLLNQIPRMIIEKNIHGIDIDPRAVQIAALALWLRAQKTWKTLGLKADARPRIAKSNIVTAEPMPGEEDMRREFTAGLKPRVLGQIVDEVFEKMKLAGEAGSLLKIEEEIKDAVAAAGKQWREGPKPEQQLLFPAMDAPRPKQQELRFDVKGITDVRFWEQAEDRILDALKEYAERAENGHATRRRLFAEDAARGFAFIELCRKRYDVVLMNPPFGQPTNEVFQVMRSKYKGAHNDIFCSFVRWAVGALKTGRVGVITSRSFLLAPRLEAFRTNDIIPNIEHLVDFGLGVMDDAYVESAAYVLNSIGSTQFHSFDLRSNVPEHQQAIEHQIGNHLQQLSHNSWFYKLPKSKILYTAPPEVRKLLNSKTSFEPTAGTAREGMKSFNNERFIRLWWEIHPSFVGKGNHWVHMAKGGGFSFFYSDIHLLLNWSRNGLELQAVNQAINGSTAQVRQASDYWYLPGATYSKRSARGFSARALPSGCIFTSNGPAVLPYGDLTPAFILGWLNSKPVRAIIHMQANFADYSTGALKKIPWLIRIQDRERKDLERATVATIDHLREAKAANETSICFRFVHRVRELSPSVDTDGMIRNLMELWDSAISESYGFDDLRWAEESLNEEVEDGTDTEKTDEDEEPESGDSFSNASSLIAYLMGCILGRWDIRIAIDPSLPPKLPDPFDPLPVCPPGMLVGPDGLPAEPERIVSEEWLRARPDANSLPPDGSVMNPTIPDSEYPLRISWDGVLVDDPGFNGDRPHRDDIVRRVREVFDLLWKDRAHEIEQEACDILGVSDLRDYFRRPAGFFQDHLKRYSKSRRKAPIYWPLSTPSGSYTIWLYYHRLTDQTIYAAVNKYVEPKISEVERGIGGIENDLKSASGRDATRLTDRLSEARTFLGELRDLREELLRIAALPFKPNLNDGLVINASPFHNLFRLRPWAKDTEDCWKKLAKGDYDWAHLAYTIWPDRVREVCRTDRSIAIAHGLEDLCEVEAPGAKKKGGRGRRRNENS